MNKNKLFFYIMVGMSALSWGSTMTLEQYLERVKAQNKTVQSLMKSIEVAEHRRVSTDISLSPILTAQGLYMDDMKPNATMPYYMVTETKGNMYSLGLAKQFSTGTQGSVSANLNDLSMNVTDRMTNPAGVKSNMNLGTGGATVSLSQSLWKDSFGRATRLRHEREGYSENLEKASQEILLQQVLIEAEAGYWDFLYLQDELKQRKESLDRARRIETWVHRRVDNGIGDKGDLLNAQGLVAARELQLLVSEDELTAMKKKMADVLELDHQEVLPEMTDDMRKIRAVSFTKKMDERVRVLRLDTYLAVLESKAKTVGASEVEEAYRPDLTLAGSYSTNSYDTINGVSGAASKITDTSMPTTNIVMKLTWALDSEVKDAVKNVAKKEALASTLKKEQKFIESDTSWAELKRRHSELTKKIQAAKIMMDIQKQKALVEQDKLTKGRTVTSQVITAEQDAAEAELTLTKLFSEQRKLESQSRLFTSFQE